MDVDDRDAVVQELTARAARLDELADTAELMGDEHALLRFRSRAEARRSQAFALLDDRR